MTTITAADVKRLRDLTGAGMLDCKNALAESDGDFDKAVELLRIKGAAKAAKRGVERTAGNGLVAAADGALVEINCETDFVAKNDRVIELAQAIATAAAQHKPVTSDTLGGVTLPDGQTVSDAVSALAAVIGEKLVLGRVATFDGRTTSYLHRRSSDLPPQVGVLVEFAGEDAGAARGAAMQIAAMRPRYVRREEVPDDIVASERRIAEETARAEGRPEQAIPRIVEGRVGAFFRDFVLLEQPSVLEQKETAGAVLKAAGVEVSGFARFEVGEG